jgi:hypothetical protein
VKRVSGTSNSDTYEFITLTPYGTVRVWFGLEVNIKTPYFKVKE